ncbi:Hpt domain-containing protein [Polaromonas sp.]|jgi:chemosensory pili system protein ChpA (sensor histidine kinase/response regulator)|uniref:Hpt domain-containing protein n=1 Tax=Polaromonas sp. TaxID=1869339 RepID=UPI002BBA10E5|nr:Hpt domain-containing protein [Polaromonas sp.]HQS30756.1 Hpt domain-containing protein [Polaromonas sp.]HQS89906.1 Hpt domain-containing protein [Polaromonas sp.]
MQSNAQNSKAAELELAVNDLGPLAWVLDELRKSLDSAAKALKRFVRDADAARGSDLAALDSSQLRIARQQLHQAVGALEMVGLQGPALVLRAMEAAVQKFVQQPEHCSIEAAARIERASFALTEYLQGILSDRRVSAVSLFPQYREVQELVKADRIHPADLWPLEWRWLEPDVAMPVPPQGYDSSARSRLDQGVLKLMKGRAVQTAGDLRDLGLGLSAAQTSKQPRIFWKIVAAYFEALAHDVLEPDLYVRRATSRILLQYASLAKGEVSISDRLAHDLLFFCAQAAPTAPAATPVLSAVRAVYGLSRFKPVNYELVQFGRFDPALLAQARKRITSAKETWSSLSAGDVNKFKSVADQFSLVTDSLAKLHPPSEPLAQALTRAVETTVRAAQSPRIELAMEVATSLLYLEAVFDDLDPNDPQLAIRTLNLAERLDGVRTGGEPQPLESWMEELYSRVSDKQTMGSVVGELRVSLGELEKALDAFFRDPSDKPSLQPVPAQLSQMRGVLSVLGLDQASHAVARMRESVEEMLVTEVDEERARAAGTFDQLGNNVGALSFLIDMLNYQPVLAKKLFVYDEEKGELKPLMGRASNLVNQVSAEAAQAQALSQEVIAAVHDAGHTQSDASVSERLIALADQAALADQPALAKTAREASLAFSSQGADAASLAVSALTAGASFRADSAANQSIPVDFEEDDLRDIFLEEAREVIAGGREAILALSDDTHSVAELTVLRRAFHTLKGSSRMVGLNEFGEAAWSLEQLLNGWLADQKPANDLFRAFCNDIFAGFERWVDDIAANRDSAWLAAPFSKAADAMRSEGKYSALVLPVGGAASSAPAPAMTSLIDVFDLPDLELVEPVASDATFADDPVDPVPLELTSAEASEFDFDLPGAEPFAEPALVADLSDLEIIDFDFESLSAVSSTPLSPGLDDARVSALPVLSAGHDVESTPQAPDAEFEQFFTESPAPTSAADDSLVSDFSSSLQPVSEPAGLVVVEPIVAAEVSVSMLDLPESAQPSAGLPRTDHQDEEQVKVIGGLRIGIPLYNVYLNEADEWSRRLVTEVAEWSLERHQPVFDSTIALAHSLAGSSATVGFHALSEIARALEGALQQSHNHHVHGAAAYGQLFVDASEDIRRLLHQFAAGFLKEPDARLLGALRELEFNDSILPPGNNLADFYFEAKSTGVEEVEEHEEADEAEEIGEAERTGQKPVVLAKPEELPHEPDRASGYVPLSSNLSPAPVVSKPVPAPAGLIVPAAEVVARSLSMPTDFSEEGAEDIDATDAIDPELFPIFEEEAAELMPQLGGALRQWSARPDNASARNEVLRALHTLKGSARLAGAMRLGEIAHRIESEIESIGSESAAAQDFEELLGRFDAMQANFEALSRADAAAASSTAIALHVASAESSAKVEPEAEAPAAATEATPLSVADAATDDESRSRKIAVPAPQAMVMRPLRQAAAATVRVRSQLLDRMVNQAGEVMITRSRLEAELGQLRGSLTDMSSNLNRLRQQLRDIELQAETQMQSRLAQAKEAQAGFDPLEFDRFTRVQELTRMMAESVNDVATVQRTLQRTVEATEDDLIAQARQTRELQRDLLRTRMVEFEGISDRLYRVVRQASKDTGKQVRLDLLGGTIEMDRGMLDRMTPAFEHLLRNCVAHGIEDPQDRVKAGKDPVGLITVHLRHEGNDVSVDFSDDGAGLDLRRIREKALSLGVVTADQVLGDQEASNLIFMPGFTTAAQVTELAGRGIGMDVVRSEVNSLGGRIETSTAAGQGTHFKLVLPLTTAVTQVVMIRSGDLSVGVPANVVETVRRTTAKELQQAYNTGFMDVSGETVPFFWSGALLQASRHSNEPPAKTASVVIFRSAAQRIALHVDEVLGNQEVVVKNLGPQLSRLPGLAGMSVLASGAVVLIYNPVALASIYGDQARAWSSDKAEPHMLEGSSSGAAVTGEVVRPGVAQIPLILVVDDSITVRRVTQRLLQREGYRVSMAADGLQALERLQEEVPAVVLSDIEMPRMDGFDLARNIRADARLKGIPIIMITSRIAGKHREHAMELGVDHYLGKPYSEEELISLVRHYCAESAVSA